jgi:hypothetical protein
LQVPWTFFIAVAVDRTYNKHTRNSNIKCYFDLEMERGSLTSFIPIFTIMLASNSFTTTIFAQNNPDSLASNPPLFNTPYQKVYPACLAYRLPNNPTIYCNLARQHAILDSLCHNSFTQTCQTERGYFESYRQTMSDIANAVLREKTGQAQNPSLGNSTGR